MFAGAVQVIVADLSPATATTSVGADGTSGVVTAAEGTDAALVPAALVAVTEEVYDVPFASPVTAALVPVTAKLADGAAGVTITVYAVIALPPLLAGTVQLTAADPTPAVATTPVGASGTVIGVTAADAWDAGPVPAAFTAATVNVYEVPFVRPVTVALVAVPAAVALAPPGLAVTM